jgi:tetratricopeptide (TPR) repeat protein
VEAVRSFPPTPQANKSAKQVFAESYTTLSGLAKTEKNEKPFARAMAWKAYALALSVYESWPLPATAAERRMPAAKRLQVAEDLAEAAIKLDRYDHDLHWALADVRLMRKDFPGAVKAFRRALFLNEDERNPNLFAEAASAFMHYGDHDEAEKYFNRAKRRPDWHHWMHGILLVMKAGREGQRRGGSEETFLNLALDELKATRAQADDELYQEEIHLVLAAAYRKKAKLLLLKARKTKDPEDRKTLQRLAARNQTSAEREIRFFRDAFGHWKRAQVETALPFGNQADKAYFMSAIRELWP